MYWRKMSRVIGERVTRSAVSDRAIWKKCSAARGWHLSRVLTEVWELAKGRSGGRKFSF